jgi:hypothetical protein
MAKFRVRFVDGSEIYMEAENYEAAALALGECLTASTPIDVYSMDSTYAGCKIVWTRQRGFEYAECKTVWTQRGTGLFNPNLAISIREVN